MKISDIDFKIKIGTSNFEVLEKEIISINQDSGYIGACYHDDEEIHIKKDLKNIDMVLLHEVMHAICIYFCLDDLNKDETKIDLLSKGVLAFIKDNSELIKKLLA